MDAVQIYCLGGLETPDDNVKTLNIEGTNYVVSDKFKSMLRDSFIDWGTFLEIYNKHLNVATMFDQMVKLLNVDANENLRESMIPIVEKIYNLPADAHMACMVKQFMLFEPVSMAVHSLFTTIKHHFEYTFEKFLLTRNKYIIKNELLDATNDMAGLHAYWESAGDHYDSSSIKLLFMNPPDGLTSGLNFKVSGKEKVINKLKAAVRKFKYMGFCPKVPHERMDALLKFPINEFNSAILELDPTAELPDYVKLEGQVKDCTKNLPTIPKIVDNIKRKKIPADITDKIEVAKWYINNILDLRKQLIKYGAEFEEYYTNHAKIIMEINSIVKKDL
jgi:hypothetical protein